MYYYLKFYSWFYVGDSKRIRRYEWRRKANCLSPFTPYIDKIKRKNKNERNLLTYDSVRCIIEYALQKRAANKKEKNKTVDFIDQPCYD